MICPLCNKDSAYCAEYDKSIVVCRCKGLQVVGKMENIKYIPFDNSIKWNIKKINNIENLMLIGKKLNIATKLRENAEFYFKQGDTYTLYSKNILKYIILVNNKKIFSPRKSFLSGYGLIEVREKDIDSLFDFLISNKIILASEKQNYIKGDSVNGKI